MIYCLISFFICASICTSVFNTHVFDVSLTASLAMSSIDSLELLLTMTGWMETVVDTTNLLAFLVCSVVVGLTSEISRILSRCFFSAEPKTIWRISLLS